MSVPRVLVVLSADFGEHVTASLFCRDQPFEAKFAIPAALARFAAGDPRYVAYRDLAEVEALAVAFRPELVLLASGYLFAVNGLASVERLTALMERLRAAGASIATTDPWLRIWALRPGTRFAIHSVRRGGEDAALSAYANALQRALEERLAPLPHVFAVPLQAEGQRWLPFFNPALAPRAAPEPVSDEWLFVLSREDYVFLAGFEKQAFFDALERRVRELLARRRNRVRFVAPEEVGRFVAQHWPGEARVAYEGFCDFATFEAGIRRARVVVYWNLLSSSLLYCLYFGVPPIFFGAGHMAKVCPGLEAHAAQHVYRGRPPRILALAAPLVADAAELVTSMHLDAWVRDLREDYAHSPRPAAVLERMRAAA